MNTLLELRGITKTFGGIKAVHKVSFHVYESEFLGLIGPNGAGKTTLFNLITRLANPTEGKILYDGKNLLQWPQYQIARRGITRTFQTTRLFSNLTGMENLLIAREAVDGKTSKEKEERLRELLVLFNIEHKKHMLAKEMCSADQRRLMIVLALCSEPKIILLDEPTAGMNMRDAVETLQMVDNLRKRKIAVLLIEHNIRAVREVVERLVVLQFGEILAQGKACQVLQDSRVIEAYLGEEYVNVT